VTDRPEHYYIFAVDRTKKPTQKRITKAISDGIGTGKTESIELESVVDEEWAEFFNINLKIKSSPVLRDGQPPEDAEDPEKEAEALKFPWHAEKGIIGNARLLNDEFNKYLNLNPVKIFVSGPPASGKSHYGEKLAKYYNIPHITVKDAAALMDSMKGEWADGIREKIEAIKDEMMEEAEKNKKKGGEVTREELFVRLEEKWIYKLMREKLNENDCRNRGFVLDGYPRTFNDACKVFLVKKKKFVKNDDGELVEEEEEEEPESDQEEEQDADAIPEEKKEKDWSNYETDKNIVPGKFILLQGENDYLKNRVKELPEDKISGTHWNDADMERRIKAYRDANNSELGDPSLLSFFKKYEVSNFAQEVTEEEDKAFEAFKIFIE